MAKQQIAIQYMPIKKTTVLAFMLLFLFVGHAQIDSTVAKTLSLELLKNSASHPSESVYLQTSKGIYETGEDLWFKGYVLNSQSLAPSTSSKTFFVQLVEDATQKAVWQEKYGIANGFVDGHVYVHDTLRSGAYTLTGHTPHSFYDDNAPVTSIRKLRVVKNITAHHKTRGRDTSAEGERKNRDIDFQMFPEGGHLVSGLQGRLAFKAVDSTGHPVKVSGTLFENGDPLRKFKSTHAGMGSFRFVPHAGNSYHVQLSDTLETAQKRYSLPKVQNSGMVMQLRETDNEFLVVKIGQTKGSAPQRIYIRTQTRGNLQYIATAVLKESLMVKIPIDDMPRGITEVTLFNETLKPMAERLVFVNQDQGLDITGILDKSEYLTKGKVKLKIKATDHDGNPVSAHLGLGVFDKAYENPKDGKTIETHYHLSTQLKGSIYDPRYYFDKKNKDRKQALDLLLLTQGWRAYEWGTDNVGRTRGKASPILSDTVTGKLHTKNKKMQRLLSEQYIMGFVADDGEERFFIEVDSTAGFKVYPEELQRANRGYLYLKPLLEDPKRSVGLRLDETGFGAIDRLRGQKGHRYPMAGQKVLTKRFARPFIVADDVNQLEEVMVTGKSERVFRDKYMGTLDSIARLEHPDYVCEHNFLNCKTCGRGSKPIEGGIHLVWLGEGHHHGPLARPFAGKDVKTIEYHYPKLTEEELLKQLGLSRAKGYYGKRKFYSPVYGKEEQLDGFPDYRNTLFWKPDILTNEQGEFELEFSTSDLNTRFKGVIEGVDGNGLLGRETFEFKVKKRE